MLLSQGHANSRVMHVERTHTSSTVAVTSVYKLDCCCDISLALDIGRVNKMPPRDRCDILLQVAVAIGAAKAHRKSLLI